MFFRFESSKIQKLYETGKGQYPPEVIKSFFKTMATIEQAEDENELRAIKGNHFEKLSGKKNLYSIRLNRQYRLEFCLTKENEIKIMLILSITNHYA